MIRWVLACSLAEAAAIAVVSVFYASVDRGLLAPAEGWILLAGGCEGLLLGAAQAINLRRLHISPGLWILLTVAGAIAGYGLSLLGGAGEQGTGDAFEPALWMMVLLGASVGLGMGVAMGLIQSPALRGRLSRKAWIVANAVGWMPAMAAIMTGAGLAQPNWTLAEVALAGAVSGAAAGLCVGIATGVVVTRTKLAAPKYSRDLTNSGLAERLTTSRGAGEKPVQP